MGLSVLVHGAFATILWSLPSPVTEAHVIFLELSRAEEEGVTAAPDPRQPGDTSRGRAALVHGGRASAQNIDGPRQGEGGDLRGASQVILLLERADLVTVQDSPMNSRRAAQTQRIRTGADRDSRELRRATPNPGDTPYLASFHGHHPERRRASPTDPATGAALAPTPSSLGDVTTSAAREPRPHPGGDRGTPWTQGGSSGRGDDDRARDATRLGGYLASPGTGIAAGQGSAASAAAPVAFGRPPVDRGPAATMTEPETGRVQDNADAELLAAQMVQSMVEATQRRGAEVGAGAGGIGGGGAPGSGGGRGSGGRASAYGPGGGRYASLDTGDHRYQRWFLRLSRCVAGALRFPRQRQIAMDQGTSVYRFGIGRDGFLVADPRLLRSSGFSDLDQAALAAIHSGAHGCSRVPGDLAPNLEVIPVTLPVEFANPMVH